MFASLQTNEGSRRTPTQRAAVVCTIGPGCRSLGKMLELIRAGMNVARLHFYAVLLSGETAVGKHRVAATAMMVKVAAAACRHFECSCSVELGSRKNNALVFSKIVRTNEARKQS